MKNSPIKELTAQDIARKQKKLDRINTKIGKKEQKFKDKVSSGKKGTDMDITRHERSLSGLKERKHKTEHQIKTGERGRPTSLKNEAWLAGTSRKSSSPVNNYKDGYYGVERKSALNMIGIGNITKGVKNVVDSAIDSHWKSEEDAWRKSGKGNVPSSAYAVYDRGRRTKFGPGQGKGDQGPKGAFEYDTPRLRTKYEDNPGDDKTHSYKSWKK
ncbi:MAG: hypothetical protein H8E55_32030 [Pelagibacterales bacterium]|nr:hypothetical protein [Pelagibacterales bacterium]